MKKDNIELPPLPVGTTSPMVHGSYYCASDMQDYARDAIKADRQQRWEPAAVIRFERNKPGNENEMPKVISCNRLPDGDYQVFLAPQTTDPEKETRVGQIMEAVESYGDACRQSNITVSEQEMRLHGIRALLARYGLRATPEPSDAQSKTDSFRNGVAKVLGLGSEGNRFADTYLLGLIGDLVELVDEFPVRDERRIAMRETTRHLLYEHKDVFSSHPKKSDLRKHIMELDAENDRLHALLTRYGSKS